jgi:hypothetical protein
MIRKPLSYREKQLTALRITYMGGYSGYFVGDVARLLRKGFSVEEMKAAAVDDTMRKWIDDAVSKMPQGEP